MTALALAALITLGMLLEAIRKLLECLDRLDTESAA